MSEETLAKIREIGWQPCEEGKPLPDNVKRVLLFHAEDHGCGDDTAHIFNRPPDGWFPIIGWALWFPLP